MGKMGWQVEARRRNAQGWCLMSEWGLESKRRSRSRRALLALTLGRSFLVCAALHAIVLMQHRKHPPKRARAACDCSQAL